MTGNKKKNQQSRAAAMENQTPHIAIVPTPGMGHLIPLAEFAKRLVAHHNFTVTFVVPTNGSPTKEQKAVLEALPKSIDHLFLPPVTFNDLPEGEGSAAIETLISLTVARSLSPLRDVLISLQLPAATTKLVAVVVDLFATDVFDVAKELKISPYIFFPSTAMTLSLFLHLPTLDAAVSCEYRDLPEPVRIPGCIPIHGRDLLDPVQNRKNDAYKWTLHHAKRYSLAEGIMVNSFMDLEPGAIKSLQEVESGKPPVYPVGPLIRMDSSSGIDGSGCLKWLDDQPPGSVLFVSFGSGGTLSSIQLNELAMGLEMSNQRFLWVVRSPNDQISNGTYFNAQSHNDSLNFLPKGFLERTKGKGLVVPNWAPQAQILGHRSTGGFLTHCGWNSTLESVVSGVPLIAWPLFAEQKMNAVILAEDIKVALRPKTCGNGDNSLVGKNEIAVIVKSLMEGEEGKKIRNRMKDLKDSAAYVLSENGSSTKALAELAHKWKNQIST